MSEHKPVGTIMGLDLTVPDAENVRDFYTSVVGWEVEMLGDDYVMKSPSGEWVGGVCHRRGENADLPPVWLAYIAVADLDSSLAACTAGGGRALTPIKGGEGEARYCVIEDPAGAIIALLQQGPA